MNKRKLRKILAILDPAKKADLLVANLADDIKAVEKKIPVVKDYSQAIQELRLEMVARFAELPDLTTDLLKLKTEFEAKLLALEKQELGTIQTQMQELVSNDITTDENLRSDLETQILKVRTEFLKKLANLGGGQANRRIRINATELSKKYTDINFKGNGVTYAAADNDTTKEVDLTLTATGSGVTTVASADGTVTVTNPTTTPDLAVVKAPKLSTARTIAGVSFDGTANIALASTGLSDTAIIAYLNALFAKYNNISTQGWGVPAIYGNGRAVAQTAAVASVATYTVGAADGSFLVSANVLVTTSTTHSFSIQVDYTDEGNTARTVTFNVQQLGGTLVTAITNITGAGPYEGVPLHIRCKASTAITIKTTGTFTTITYNVDGNIMQIS